MRKCGTYLAVVLFICGCSRKQATVPAAPPPLPPAAPSKTTDVERRSRQGPRRIPAPSIPSQPPPALGEMIPTATRQQLVREIEAALERAKNNVSMLQSRTPTAERQRGIARVETFIIQAQDARTANDLPTARGMAERADLLSQDLLRAP